MRVLDAIFSRPDRKRDIDLRIEHAKGQLRDKAQALNSGARIFEMEAKKSLQTLSNLNDLVRKADGR